MREGERYKCSDAKCGTEVQVTKASSARSDESKSPRCGCGSEMRVQNQSKQAGH